MKNDHFLLFLLQNIHSPSSATTSPPQRPSPLSPPHSSSTPPPANGSPTRPSSTKTHSLYLSIQSQIHSLSRNDVAFILSPPSLHVLALYSSLLSLGIVVSPANSLSTFDELTHLSLSIQSQIHSLSQNDVAFILSPPSLHVLALYSSLLSLGIVVSPANSFSTSDELTHLFSFTKPAVVYTISSLLQIKCTFLEYLCNFPRDKVGWTNKVKGEQEKTRENNTELNTNRTFEVFLCFFLVFKENGLDENSEKNQ